MPAARQRSRNRRNTEVSKKNWVIARVAPVSSLRLRLSRSAFGLAPGGAFPDTRRPKSRTRRPAGGRRPGPRHSDSRRDAAHRAHPAVDRRATPRCAGPGRPILARHLVHLGPAAPTQVRWAAGTSAVLPHNTGDRGMGAESRGAAGAIGDRDEARRQRLQPADAAPKLSFQRLGPGREELERQQRRLRAGQRSRQPRHARAGQPALQRGAARRGGKAGVVAHAVPYALVDPDSPGPELPWARFPWAQFPWAYFAGRCKPRCLIAHHSGHATTVHGNLNPPVLQFTDNAAMGPRCNPAFALWPEDHNACHARFLSCCRP